MIDANKIRALRIKRGYSQEKLAELVGVKPKTIHRIETGQTPNPHIELVFTLAKTLLVETNDLLKTD